MAAVLGGRVGWQQGCGVRVGGVAGLALVVEGGLGWAERVGGGAAGGGRGGAGWWDGGGVLAWVGTLGRGGGVEFGVGVEGWRVVVGRGWEEREGVCFCGHCVYIVEYWGYGRRGWRQLIEVDEFCKCRKIGRAYHVGGAWRPS